MMEDETILATQYSALQTGLQSILKQKANGRLPRVNVCCCFALLLPMPGTNRPEDRHCTSILAVSTGSDASLTALNGTTRVDARRRRSSSEKLNWTVADVCGNAAISSIFVLPYSI